MFSVGPALAQDVLDASLPERLQRGPQVDGAGTGRDHVGHIGGPAKASERVSSAVMTMGRGPPPVKSRDPQSSAPEQRHHGHGGHGVLPALTADSCASAGILGGP